MIQRDQIDYDTMRRLVDEWRGSSISARVCDRMTAALDVVAAAHVFYDAGTPAARDALYKALQPWVFRTTRPAPDNRPAQKGVVT